MRGGINTYGYVAGNPLQSIDQYGLNQSGCGRKCGIKQEPAYKIYDAQYGLPFTWHAEFLEDAYHDPKCCEVRQEVSWTGEKPRHFPSTAQPNTWYEDRNKNDYRYGRRTGPHSDLHRKTDWYEGNVYDGGDYPMGIPPGDIWKFRLLVVDVCNGEKTIFTSEPIEAKPY